MFFADVFGFDFFDLLLFYACGGPAGVSRKHGVWCPPRILFGGLRPPTRPEAGRCPRPTTLLPALATLGIWANGVADAGYNGQSVPLLNRPSETMRCRCSCFSRLLRRRCRAWIGLRRVHGVRAQLRSMNSICREASLILIHCESRATILAANLLRLLFESTGASCMIFFRSENFWLQDRRSRRVNV